MEIKMDLAVSKESFFNLLLDSILYDINENLEYKINKNDLKLGYTYEKKIPTKFGKKKTVKIVIENIKNNENYSVSFNDSDSKTSISYSLKDTDSGSEILYSEQFETSKKIKRLNYDFFSIFLSKKNKKKIKNLIKSMEQYILQMEQKVIF